MIVLVTDRSRLTPRGGWQSERDCLLEQARQAVSAGVDIIQVRERDLEAGQLVALVAAMVSIAQGSRTRVLVNDRLDVAVAANAHGVHLRSDSISAADVRHISPKGFMVGRSVHSVAEAAKAVGVDYLIAGTVWDSESKPGGRELIGLEGLKAIVGAAAVPVVAIGGMTLDRAAEIAAAGAAGVAAIGLFQGARGFACRAVPLSDVVETLRSWFDTPGSRS